MSIPVTNLSRGKEEGMLLSWQYLAAAAKQSCWEMLTLHQARLSPIRQRLTAAISHWSEFLPVSKTVWPKVTLSIEHYPELMCECFRKGGRVGGCPVITMRCYNFFKWQDLWLSSLAWPSCVHIIQLQPIISVLLVPRATGGCSAGLAQVMVMANS